ncbi:hypothetical protein SAMD00019534_093040 [Acytostelium subglobosum LB1]|uniref:hypothetical protein n=1 Tax=Acytostelium subglobosum LB1 TaxID=1410327 RepID=UPI000644B3AE|nr:hypothetical protein SAMD00019534_093040 [Acytostelium subglobosum LB1]GAM26129.1 hypothetical protein SAMD00019534_093040 [Acytostelium subglobosum LB1]|eukprot:XP_012751172.1 hypothetical protein SAMD00019534_093040 [Acytostelium subglobosum LB1]
MDYYLPPLWTRLLIQDSYFGEMGTPGLVTIGIPSGGDVTIDEAHFDGGASVYIPYDLGTADMTILNSKFSNFALPFSIISTNYGSLNISNCIFTNITSEAPSS